ncbi:MAG: nucleotidyl transferase AbiEii/AbiGii toxin family protein [Candidatus Omnitrophica bacterium]|nr:nucleotidyl transferase AbiEii/AbiGii toxin family protein [Candidatus Omnitrophota bacterium]
MSALADHEVFELEVLEVLNKAGFLRPLVFGGGTMLRLCHELPRYSVDLDFWFSRKTSYRNFHAKLSKFLEDRYRMTDVKNKHFTLLYEFRGGMSGRKLKVEIRKELVTKGLEQAIAYSRHGSSQVLVRALSLKETARRKMLAVRSRDEMRDYFDLEFLLRKGVKIRFTEADKTLILGRIHRFKKSDYGGILGGLLEKDLRDYYIRSGFSYLAGALNFSGRNGHRSLPSLRRRGTGR